MLCSKCHSTVDALTGNGLCEDCHAQAEDRRLQIIELAKQYHEREGAVEIDDNAQLSAGNLNGCFVQAWVWVDFEKTPFDKNKEEDEEDSTP